MANRAGTARLLSVQWEGGSHVFSVNDNDYHVTLKVLTMGCK
jgi:hypothetical protein